MTMNHKDAQAHILAQFDRGDVPEPGPLRWLVDGRSDAHPVLQQQWRGPVSGKRIWVDVPTDVAEADEPEAIPGHA